MSSPQLSTLVPASAVGASRTKMFSKRRIVLTVFLLLGAGAVTHIWLQLDAGSNTARVTRVDPRSTARRSRPGDAVVGANKDIRTNTAAECKPWCADHKATWSEKCCWDTLTCAACAACTHHGRIWSQPAAQQVTAEAATEGVDKPTALAVSELKKAKQVLSHID